MNWEEESVSGLIKDMQKNYIECELMNYYYHLHLRDKYAEMVKELQIQYYEELGSPSCGGSIIRMPEKNNNVRSPWQIDLGSRIDCLIVKKELEEQHLRQVDTWINGIKLSSDQFKVIKQYVMLREDANRVADDTGYTEKNVWKIRERTVQKIYFEFFRKKCRDTDT